MTTRTSRDDGDEEMLNIFAPEGYKIRERTQTETHDNGEGALQYLRVVECGVKGGLDARTIADEQLRRG